MNTYLESMTSPFPIDPARAPNTPERLRKEVKNLFESYHATDLDLLIEIAQNAFDALEDKYSTPGNQEKPEILLNIDTTKGIITISDNGPGLPDDVINILGLPDTTDKEKRGRRGHKGVGLAFAIWSSDLFRFATKRIADSEVTSGKLAGGHGWVLSDNPNCPKIEEDPSFKGTFPKGFKSGTVFEFTMGPAYKLFALAKRLKAEGCEVLIRTTSAIGYLDASAHDSRGYPEWVRGCKVVLTVDNDPPHTTKPGYYYPEGYFGKESIDMRALKDISTTEFMKLKGSKRCLFTVMSNESIKDLFDDDESDHRKLVEDQNVWAYGAFLDWANSFKTWNEALYKANCGPGARRRIVKPGIHFGTSTMPVGDVLDIELAYGTGNKNRLYIVVQFKDVHPDTGRKTFSDDVREVAQAIARRMAKELVDNRHVLIEHETPHGDTETEQLMSLHQLKEKASSKEDLGLQNLGVAKVPTNEQEVVALFHALIARNDIKGFKMLSVFGSAQKYDAVFDYHLEKNAETEYSSSNPLGLPDDSFPKQKNPIDARREILEFKYNLSDLIANFEDNEKKFEELKVVVAWQVGDPTAFQSPSEYMLEEVRPTDKRKQYCGETHFVNHGSSYPIHAILLKDVIRMLTDMRTGSITRTP